MSDINVQVEIWEKQASLSFVLEGRQIGVDLPIESWGTMMSNLNALRETRGKIQVSFRIDGEVRARL